MSMTLRTLTLVVSIASLSAGGLASAQAQSGTGAELDFPEGVVPPRLSIEQVEHYRTNPAEWSQLLSRLPRADQLVYEPPPPPATVGGTWTKVAAAFPGSNGAHNPLLMMDGTVIVHELCTGKWWELKPNIFGSYSAGTWSSIASLPSGHNPLYFASQVLPDGRVIVNGGEYNPSRPGACGKPVLTNRGAIYNPSTNVWTNVLPPAGWTKIGDAQSVVLPNQTYMLANAVTKQAALFNASTLTWASTGAGKFDRNDEEGWSLLQNGKVFTADAYTGTGICGKGTEIYNPATGAWTNAGNSPVQLSDCSTGGVSNKKTFEVGPQVVRHSGNVVMLSGKATGTPAGTAVYNPVARTFVQGANVPAVTGKNYTLADAPAVLLPNGKVLFAASPSPAFSTPTHYFEYILQNRIQLISNDAPGSAALPSYMINFLVLPTGQILKTDNRHGIHVYTPGGLSLAAWAPVITFIPSTLLRGSGNLVLGTQLNGLSEAGAYGDDQQSSTNFPLVRLRNNKTGHIFYCRTVGQTTRSIAPNQTSSAAFDVPTAAETGPSTAVVVVNGITSTAVSVTVH